MPSPWKRMYVEMYGPNGSEGRWDVQPPPGRIIDEAKRDEMLVGLRKPNPEYPDSHVEWADCGTDLVFGYFHHGARPKGSGPKHTNPTTAPMPDDVSFDADPPFTPTVPPPPP